MELMSLLGQIYQLAIQEESQRLAMVEHGRNEGVALATPTEPQYRSFGTVRSFGSTAILGEPHVAFVWAEEKGNPKGFPRMDG